LAHSSTSARPAASAGAGWRRHDGCLHVLLGRVDVPVQLVLKGDLRGAELEIDVICESAGIWPNCRSSGVVTADAIVSALAPGSSVETTMVG